MLSEAGDGDSKSTRVSTAVVDTYSCTCSGTDARGTKFTAVGPVWVLTGTRVVLLY